MEIYKDIEGYEGLYQISNLGNVKSLERKVIKGNGNGGLYILPERILKPGKGGNGYYLVVLSKDGKHKNKMIHRLVAEAFIPNPDQLQYINHKDENPANNIVENLEWCTPKYNCNYGRRNEKISEKMKIIKCKGKGNIR